MKNCHVLVYHTTEQGVAAYISALVNFEEVEVGETGTKFVRCPKARHSREVLVALCGFVVLLECLSDAVLFGSATDASCNLALDVGLGFGQSHG